MAPTNDFPLLEDSLSRNIPPNIDFLQWPVSEVHADCFVNPPIANPTGEVYFQNHWAMILRTPDKQQVRINLERRRNSETGALGVLMVRKLTYSEASHSTVHRETFRWQPPVLTIRHVLEFIVEKGWHRYEMLRMLNGVRTGCRFHLQTMLKGFQDVGWISMNSINDVPIERFLPYVYEPDGENNSLLTVEPRDIEAGFFLYSD